MLWHYRKRAEECASRIINTKSDSVRQDYQRLLEGWKALIKAEETRLSRIASTPQVNEGRSRVRERPRIQLVRAPYGEDAILDRPMA